MYLLEILSVTQIKKGLKAAYAELGLPELKALPAVGLVVGIGMNIPRLNEARAEDLAYQEAMQAMGAEPKYPQASEDRLCAVIAGEEIIGEVGSWAGGAAGLPAFGVGAIPGSIGGGMAGDWAGGKVGGAIYDSFTD